MEIFDLLLHFEEHLENIVTHFGPYIYAILFFIIFAETGFVVTPFLPGDSLLFVVGTLAGGGYLNIWIIYFLLLIAAIAGNTLNYWLGHHIGHRVFAKKNSKIFNKAHLEKTREFFEKHGGKTIILSRFLPVVRSFAPFVAGMGSMNYKSFQLYNIAGGFLWVTSLTFAGYFFGGLEIVKNNFEYAVILIIVLSLIPAIIEYLKHLNAPKKAKSVEEATYSDIQKTFKEEHLKE